MKDFCQKITKSHFFEQVILGVIIINALVIGVETSPDLAHKFAAFFKLFHQIVLLVFILEAAIKIIAEYPRVDRYFRNPWNIFDFTILILSFLPASGSFATAARLARILRVTRLISAVPELRIIICTLLKSLPGMMHIILLLGILFYIYGILGIYLFRDLDPEHWGSLGKALLTLFGIVTLEGWVDIMENLLPYSPHSWLFFVSLIILGTFMFINLFVAVVINNLHDTRKEIDGADGSIQETKAIRDEIQRIHQTLKSIELKINQSPNKPT